MALRNLEPGELIFSEHPVAAGPGDIQGVCIVCCVDTDDLCNRWVYNFSRFVSGVKRGGAISLHLLYSKTAHGNWALLTFVYTWFISLRVYTIKLTLHQVKYNLVYTWFTPGGSLVKYSVSDLMSGQSYGLSYLFY